jgi:hypothetical protein
VVIQARGFRHPAALVQLDVPAISAPGLHLLRPDLEQITSSYLVWCLNHPKTQAAIAAVAQGTHAPFIAKQAMARVEIPVPPLATQHRVDLGGTLWRAAAAMRESTADWPRYKDYIVAILLLRFLSNWRDRTLNVYRRKYNGDEIRITRAMSRERFVVPDDCTFKRLYDQRGTRSLGATINSLLLRLVEVNPERCLEAARALVP